MPSTPLIPYISCPICVKVFNEKEQRPISLSCGHTICKSCLTSQITDKCPFDQHPLPNNLESLPANFALMQVIGVTVPWPERGKSHGTSNNPRSYELACKSIEEMAAHLRPLLEADVSDISEDDGSASSFDDQSSNVKLDEREDLKDTKTETDNLDFEHVDKDEAKNADVKSALKNPITNSKDNSHSKNEKSIHKKTERPKRCQYGISNLTNSQGYPLKNYKNSRHPKHTVSLNHRHQQDVQDSSQNKCLLSRPIQRKLITLVHCQLLEEEGRLRSARIARTLGERVVMELLTMHQVPHQLSSNLWAAVRTRGCQFLGPAMQEEVLKLILLALEDGSPLSRKVLVLFVVQKLESCYPQASKTAIGHVVQLLYRASCFKVQKRDGESSLMQLKEEFCQYDALRREHDSQIVQIALEAGLRISPEQWSSLLYGDVAHKPHMQSIIDKHQNPQSFSQNVTELMTTLQRYAEAGPLLRLHPHLEFLSNIDPSPDCPAPSWENLEAVMRSLNTVLSTFVDYLSHQGSDPLAPSPEVTSSGLPSLSHGRYKTSMCRDFTSKGSCPRGAACTFAHSKEELERYRSRSRRVGTRTDQGKINPLQVQPGKTSTSTTLGVGNVNHGLETRRVSQEPSQNTDLLMRLDQLHVVETDVNKSKSPHANSSSPTVSSLPNPGQIFVHKSSGPATHLTFSRPDMHGDEETYRATAVNQQTSLHPNNLARKQAMFNTVPCQFQQQNMMYPPPSLMLGSQPCEIVPETQPGIVIEQQQQIMYPQPPAILGPQPRDIVPETEAGGVADHQQQIMYPPPPVLLGSQLRDVVPETQAELVIDNSLQQHQIYDASLEYQGENTSLHALRMRKQDLIQHLHQEPTFLAWKDLLHGLDTSIPAGQQVRRNTAVTDLLVAARSTKSLDRLTMEDTVSQPYSRPQRSVIANGTHAQLQRSIAPCVVSSSEPLNSWHTSNNNHRAVLQNQYVYQLHNHGPVTAQEYSLASSKKENNSAQHNFDVYSTVTDHKTESGGNDAYSLGANQHQEPQVCGQTTYYNSFASSSVSSTCNSSADAEFSSFPADDCDEVYVPTEQITVSRFGPISRVNKMKPANAPLQVTADSHRIHLAASTIPTSRIEVIPWAEPAVKPTAHETHSIWDQSPRPSYDNIAQLMAGAAGAVTNNEKIAYQLQAVELQISMKTGHEPEPVCKMLQAAVMPNSLSDINGSLMRTQHESNFKVDDKHKYLNGEPK